MATDSEFRVLPSLAARALSAKSGGDRPFKLNSENVSSAFQNWIPLAERWGVADDTIREFRVANASPSDLDELLAFSPVYETVLSDWLAGPEATSPNPSLEYVAFSALGMACDHAKLIEIKSRKG